MRLLLFVMLGSLGFVGCDHTQQVEADLKKWSAQACQCTDQACATSALDSLRKLRQRYLEKSGKGSKEIARQLRKGLLCLVKAGVQPSEITSFADEVEP